MRLDTVILFTPQMEALANFYASGLGHAGDMHKSPGHVGFRLANGVYLGFDQVAVEGAGGLKETGVSLWFDVDSLDAAFERFVAAGATVRYAKKKLPMGDIWPHCTIWMAIFSDWWSGNPHVAGE